MHASSSREQWLTGPPGYPTQTRVRKILPEGDGRLGVIVCGESAGENEDRDGLPFRPYAEAGSILERALYRAGVPRDGLTITNLVSYRPPRNWLEGAPWQWDAIKYSKPFLDELVRARAPKAILALGGMAMRELTGLSGEKCGIGMVRGFQVPSTQYKFPDGRPIPVVGSFHPSFLRRGAKEREESGPRGKVEAAGGGTQGMALLGVLIRDILYSVQVAREGVKKFVPKPHRMGATLTDWYDALALARHYKECPIFYDFETLDSIVASDETEFEITRRDVTQVQICVAGQVWVSNWFPELLPVFREIIELPNPKADWNGRKFDRPILRDMQIRSDLGEWHDVMDFWHHAQPDLSRALQFAASFIVPECLAANTQLCLTDGTIRTLKDVVEAKDPVELWGMSEERLRIPVRVVGWHKTTVKDQRWIKIGTDLLRQSIFCTPDHKIWTKQGWKFAQDVEPGDYIRSALLGSDDLIHGTILGDGSVNEKGQLTISHGSKQAAYAALKAAHLGVKVHSYKRPAKGRRLASEVSTLATPIGRHWREKFYTKSGRTFVPPRSMAAMAIWYCDDGHWKKFVNRATGDGTASIAIDRYKEQVHDLRVFFSANFGDDLIFPQGSHLQLYLKKETRNRFYESIAPWVPTCMEYKLPPRWRGRYNGWLDKQVPRRLRVTCVDRDYKSYSVLGSIKDRYCVTVDHPTHRFFTTGGLVANCGPWKHMSAADPFWYGLLDVDVLERIHSHLSMTLKLTRHPISSVSLFEGYVDQVVQVAPVLDRMTARGIPVDEERRLALDVEFTATLERIRTECQPLFPDLLRSCDPKNGFVRVPADVLIDCGACEGTGKILVEVIRKNGRPAMKRLVCDSCQGMKTFPRPAQDIPAGWVKRASQVEVRCACWWGLPEKKRLRPATDAEMVPCARCSNTGKYVETVRRWTRLQPFLPGSWQQVLRYLQYKRDEDISQIAKGYAERHPSMASVAIPWATQKSEWKIPTDYQTGRPTTAADELERLNRKVKDPLLPLVLEFKEIDKMRGTYVRGWAPGADGKVHPHFGFKPATGQLHSQEPNAQNYPSHGVLAQRMKEMIVSHADQESAC